MIRKLSVSFAAIAAMGIAGAASADPATVTINVQVMEIAELEAVSGSDSATMVIDDSQDGFMGDPTSNSPGGDDFGNVAVVKLSTNYDVPGIRVDYDCVGGIRGFDPGDEFAQAIGVNTLNTLGVFPGGGPIAGPNDPLGPGEDRTGHNFSQCGFEISGASLPSNTNIVTPFGNGEHYFGLGASTNWGRTLTTEPTFAEPDTYVVDLIATVLP